jgi:site-specific DNA recombinase
MSKGERIRVRVRAAMAAQTQMEGRFLGGRPPYGYRLRDLGPHPNPAKAADGRRLHGLEPDPDTRDVVRRIYAMFLAGHGLYAIAETLTGEDVRCPSAHDPARNRHRSGIAWSKGAVRVILTNPRYTGRQVWNKQRTDETLLDIDDVTLGYTTTQRWNPSEKWITSEQLAHPPLIDDATFTAVQDLLAARGRGPGEHKRHRTRRPYVLRGAVICGVCERRMQGVRAAPTRRHHRRHGRRRPRREHGRGGTCGAAHDRRVRHQARPVPRRARHRGRPRRGHRLDRQNPGRASQSRSRPAHQFRPQPDESRRDHPDRHRAR